METASAKDVADNSRTASKQIKASLASAQKEYEKRNFVGAYKILTSILTTSPGSLEARFARARVSFEMERFEDALSDFDFILKAQPKNADILMERGACYIELGNRRFDRSFFDLAIKDFNLVTQIQPKNGVALNNRGLCYYNKSDFKQALADYEAACRLEPREPKYVKNVATTYIQFGDYNRAKAEFEKAKSIQPGNFYRYYDLGRLMLSRGDAKKAVEYLNTCINLNSHFPEGFMYRGLAYIDLERYEDAITDFTKAISLNVKNKSCYRYRGLAYTQLGDKKHAQKDLDMFTDEEISKTHYETGVDKLLKAHGVNSVDVLVARGLSCERASKFDDSIKNFTQAIEIERRYPAIYKLRAHAHLQMNDWKSALADYNLALWIDPFDSDALSLRAQVYDAHGKSEQALWDLNRAISANPILPDLYFEKAAICARLGKTSEASLNYRRFIKLALFRTGKGTSEKLATAKEQLKKLEKH